MYINTWSEVLTQSFQNLWINVISFIPNILIAVIIFAAGWITGTVLGNWIATLSRALKVDHALRALGVQELMAKAGYRLDFGVFLGALVKWFFILAFLLASTDVLGLDQVNNFLQVIINYLPNVIVAAFILIISAFTADFVAKLVVATAKATGARSTKIFGAICRWAIWIFGLLAALSQLGIASVFVQTFFTGVIAMLAIAGGIAFGLGGKEAAAGLISKIDRED